MDLLTIFKNLKKIEPDQEYSLRSKRLILAIPPPRRLSGWQILLESIQSGATLVLTGILLIFLLGGFSVWKSLRPFQFESLDLKSLRAEAQAIDIQIELTKLTYTESTSTGLSVTTQALPQKEEKIAPPEIKEEIKPEVQKQAEDLGLKVPSSSATSPELPLGPDEALLELSR